jgi:2-phosphoglycerate kinase
VWYLFILSMISAAPGDEAMAAYKPVVLVGGTAGSGKSSLANQLCARLSIDHRIGTGFIRAVLCSETSPERDPELFSFTFHAEDPVAHLQIQAERLRPAVLACIRRAQDEGTSLVIEGPHLLPSMYAQLPVAAFFVLGAPPPVEHRDRLHGLTHARRRISDQDWHNARLLDAHIAADAERHGVPRLVYRDNFEDFAALVSAAAAAQG